MAYTLRGGLKMQKLIPYCKIEHIYQDSLIIYNGKAYLVKEDLKLLPDFVTLLKEVVV